MSEEKKENSKMNKKIVFHFAGSETEAIIFEIDPPNSGSIKYLYKAKDKNGYKYLIQKSDIISTE